MTPLISLIIPAYKVAKYLPDCLNSVARQEGDNFEAIIVDDGSPDECPAIADEFAARDARFSVIHKQNEGVSMARNAGLAQARGEWVWFVDGDDTIAPTAVRELTSAMVPGIQMLMFQHETVPPERKAVYTRSAYRLTEADLANLRRRLIYARRDSASTPNSPLYRFCPCSASYCLYNAAFLRENGLIFRSELTKEQDVFFSFEALIRCREALLWDSPLYFYKRNSGSVSVRYNADIRACRARLLEAFSREIEKYYPDDADMRERMYCRRMQMTRPALFIYYCNAKNPSTRAARRAEFMDFLKTPEIAEAFEHIGSLDVSPLDRVIYELIRRRAFFPLDMLYRWYTGR